MPISPYHVEELQIALNARNPQHIVPVLPEHCERALDLGCGAGQTILGLLREQSGAANTRFIGIDVDHDALRAANELQIKGTFLQATGDRLPLADNSVDFVFSRVALPYMHIPRTLQEVHRVLRPDGRVWFSLHRPRRVMGWLKEAIQHGQWKAAFAQTFSLASGIMLQITGRQTRMPVTGRYLTFQSPKGMTKLLETAGFQVQSCSLEPFFIVQAVRPAIKAAQNAR